MSEKENVCVMGQRGKVLAENTEVGKSQSRREMLQDFLKKREQRKEKEKARPQFPERERRKFPEREIKNCNVRVLSDAKDHVEMTATVPRMKKGLQVVKSRYADTQNTTTTQLQRREADEVSKIQMSPRPIDHKEIDDITENLGQVDLTSAPRQARTRYSHHEILRSTPTSEQNQNTASLLLPAYPASDLVVAVEEAVCLAQFSVSGARQKFEHIFETFPNSRHKAMFWAARAKVEEERGKMSLVVSVFERAQRFMRDPGESAVLSACLRDFMVKMGGIDSVAELLGDSPTVSATSSGLRTPNSTDTERRLSLSRISTGFQSAAKALRSVDTEPRLFSGSQVDSPSFIGTSGLQNESSKSSIETTPQREVPSPGAERTSFSTSESLLEEVGGEVQVTPASSNDYELREADPLAMVYDDDEEVSSGEEEILNEEKGSPIADTLENPATLPLKVPTPGRVSMNKKTAPDGDTAGASVVVLAEVRTPKKDAGILGTPTVAVPVRRSLRNKGSAATQEDILQKTDYAYTPNKYVNSLRSPPGELSARRGGMTPKNCGNGAQKPHGSEKRKTEQTTRVRRTIGTAKSQEGDFDLGSFTAFPDPDQPLNPITPVRRSRRLTKTPSAMRAVFLNG